MRQFADELPRLALVEVSTTSQKSAGRGRLMWESCSALKGHLYSALPRTRRSVSVSEHRYADTFYHPACSEKLVWF